MNSRVQDRALRAAVLPEGSYWLFARLIADMKEVHDAKPRRLGTPSEACPARDPEDHAPLTGQPTGKESHRLDRARRIAPGSRPHMSLAFTAR